VISAFVTTTPGLPGAPVAIAKLRVSEWRTERISPHPNPSAKACDAACSAANATHRAVRLHEGFFADVMAIFFLKDDFGEVFAEILVIGTGA